MYPVTSYSHPRLLLFCFVLMKFFLPIGILTIVISFRVSTLSPASFPHLALVLLITLPNPLLSFSTSLYSDGFACLAEERCPQRQNTTVVLTIWVSTPQLLQISFYHLDQATSYFCDSSSLSIKFIYRVIRGTN